MSGNGADIGAVYQAIIALSTDMRSIRSEPLSMRAELPSMRTEMNPGFGAIETEIRGILLTERDERLTRLDHARDPS